MARVMALAGSVVLGLALAGCSQTTSGPAVGYSAVNGAVAGGAEAAVTGAMIGGVLGNVLGQEMDSSAQRKARDAEIQALEGRTGVPVFWRSGRYRGEVVPGAQYEVNTYSCRDYTHTIYGTSQPQRARASACRQPDGAWQSVS